MWSVQGKAATAASFVILTNAWKVQETTLGTEGSRDASPTTIRSWRIESTTRNNSVGEPTAYELVGSNTGIPYSSPTYPPLLQAPFAQHPFSCALHIEPDGFFDSNPALDAPNQ
jgi:Cu2+-containing amine oxidase